MLTRPSLGTMILLALFGAGILARSAAAAGDPFAYCTRVGTIDRPAAGFAPTPIPAALEPAVKALFRLPDGAVKPELYYWRCMDRAVWVCAVGANIPCGAKADLARRNRGAEAWCRDNPNADFVPAFATGHRTIYAWKCAAGRAVRGPPTGKLDRRGFQTEFWYRVAPR